MSHSDEQDFLEDTIQKHKRNLRTLKLQAVDYGSSAVPLHLHNQITTEEEALRRCEAKLRALQQTAHTTAPVPLENTNGPQPKPQAQHAAQTMILFLAADPTDTTRLRLGQEAREIEEQLQLSRERDRFTFHQRTSVRPRDISQALLDLQPVIVHFSGHGTQAGAICVEDVTGKMIQISAEALEALFELVTDTVQCVVLNACYSETQARAIAQHIPYVIGMEDAIGDHAAIAFAIGFYQAIGAGKPVAAAYKFGVVQIRLQGIPEHLTPVLLTK